MRNRFPGICYRCGKRCEANDGHFERQKWRPRYEPRARPRSVWLIQHARCAIEYRGTCHVHPSMPKWVHELRGPPEAGDAA